MRLPGWTLAPLLLLALLLTVYLASYHPHSSLYLLMGAIVLLVEFGRKKESWDYLTVINWMWIWLYVLMPIFMIEFPDENPFFVEIHANDFLFPAFVLMASYAFVVMGYRLATNLPLNTRVVELDNGTLRRIMLPIFGIAAVSLLIYAQVYGGLPTLLQNADRIRSGFLKVGSPLVFFRQPTAMLFPVVWMVFAMVIKPEKYKSYLIRGLLIAIFLGVGVVQALSTAGRSQLLYLFLPLYIGYYKWTGTRPKLWTIALVGTLGVSFILFSDVIFSGMREVEGEVPKEPPPVEEGHNAFWDFTMEFLHPMGSLLVLMREMPEVMPPNWFLDTFIAVAQLVPEKLIGIQLPDTVSSWNTMMLTGVFMATVPPGVVGFFWYSFLYAGIPIGSLIFGYFYGRLDVFMNQASRVHPIYSIFYAGITITIVGWMMGGDPRVYINLYLWGLWMSLIFIIRGSKKKTLGDDRKRVRRVLPTARKV